jgi:rod shape-determining protein MreC
MINFLRSTKITVLILLIALGITIGVMHNKAAQYGKSFLPENAVRVVMKPFQVTAKAIGGTFKGIAHSVRSQKALRRDNEQLRSEVKRLNMEVIQLREDASETIRLRSALGLREQSPEKLLPVRVISRKPSEWFVTATIDHGSSSGVEPGYAIITPRGFVGQVFEASPVSAQIHGLADMKPEDGGVGAMVQRSRATGICQGQPNTGLLHLTYLAKDADIRNGDIIVTSGQGGIAPKGVPIGRVVKIKTESGGYMKSAQVRPSVQFDQVEEAFVVIRKVD